MSITLTESAARHVSRFLAQHGDSVGLKVGVRTTGCSGMAYKLEYADRADPSDVSFESRGIRVFVDPESLQYIDGTEVDYVRDGLNESFRFNNPNVSAECGCGESFTV